MNNLPQDILNKIQLYLRHPCAEMLLDEIGFVDRVFPGQVLCDYRMDHPRTKAMGNYARVIQELWNVSNMIWSYDRHHHAGLFDYKRCLRINSIEDDSDGESVGYCSRMFNSQPIDPNLFNCHPIGPNMADGSETSSDEPDSDSESVSFSDSDTPIIAVSRRDPSIRVEVHRIRRVTDSDNERDRLHAEYLSAD